MYSLIALNFGTSPNTKYTYSLYPISLTSLMFNLIQFLVSSRQFVGVIVINPGGPHLLEALTVSQNLLQHGQNGLQKCDAILEGWVLLKLTHCWMTNHLNEWFILISPAMLY